MRWFDGAWWRTIADLEAEAPYIELSCGQCHRYGRLNSRRIADEYGRDTLACVLPGAFAKRNCASHNDSMFTMRCRITFGDKRTEVMITPAMAQLIRPQKRERD